MDVEHTVDSWLRDLPEFAPQPRRGGKRKRQIDEQDQHLASPPVSENKAAYDEMTRSDETPKKRRLGRPGADDVEATPRPNQAVGSSISLSEAASSSSVSRASSASSPKRQRLALRLHDAGIKMNVLDVDQPPKELEQVADLIGSIQDAGRAVHILPHAMEAVLGEQLRMRKLDFRKWRYAFQTSDDHVPTLPGRLPSLDEVQRIQREAAECQRHEHEEFSWNSQVHLRLLEAVFKDANGPCDSFGFTSCMTARPHNQFKVPGLTAKMVDLCIYASPDDDDEWMARIDQFSHQSPTQTVNHTDFEPIGMRPLLLSIETKKPGVHWDKAQLQMGLWHAAQWSFLAWAVGQKLTRQRSMDVAGETVDVDEREQPGDVGETVDDHVDKTQVATELQLEERRRAALSALGCLPGIIVQGHQWHLVMSSYDAKSGKTTLWADHQFGTTQGYLEIYGTIAGVRRLTAWARDVYLPWFEKHVLD